MDNITHSLIGICVGEAAAQVCAKRKSGLAPASRLFFWISSIVANNFPDLDFIISKFSPGPLGYLMHHRGHTHTFLLAIPQGIFIALSLFLFAKFRKIQIPARDWGIILFLSFLGLAMHVFADSWNSYGVHPFWPWDKNWYYGDFIFIIEPWIWLTLIPVAAYASGNKWLRRILWTIFALALVLIWTLAHFPAPISITLSIWALITICMKMLNASKRIYTALSLVALVLVIFSISAKNIRQTILSNLHTKYPQQTFYDLILTPLPGNPLCWTFVSVATENKIYKLNAGTHAAQPQLLNEEQCAGLDFNTVSFSAPTAELRALKEKYCWVDAFLRFARSPTWKIENQKIAVSDMRFQRRAKTSFSTIEKDINDTSCPPNVPDWNYPRADILMNE